MAERPARLAPAPTLRAGFPQGCRHGTRAQDHDGSSRAVAALHQAGRTGFPGPRWPVAVALPGEQVAPRASRPVTRAARRRQLKKELVSASRAPGFPRGSLRSLRSLRPITPGVIGRSALWPAGRAAVSAGAGQGPRPVTRPARRPQSGAGRAPASGVATPAPRHHQTALLDITKLCHPARPLASAAASPRPRWLPAPRRGRHSACSVTSTGGRPRTGPMPRPTALAFPASVSDGRKRQVPA